VKVSNKPIIRIALTLFISILGMNLAWANEEETPGKYDPVGTVMNHISDANEFHVWKGVHIPLPCFLYAPGEPIKKWTILSSGKFEHGHKAIDRYVINHGRVNRIADPSFPMGEVHIEGVHGK
jgi:F-type H+-transporting ATPase subunit a